MRYGYESFFESIKAHHRQLDINVICNREPEPNDYTEPKKSLFDFSDCDYRDMLEALVNVNGDSVESSPVPIKSVSAPPSGNKRKRSGLDPEVLKNYRVDLIDRFSERETMALNILYEETNGRLPSRRSLKDYSDKVGIPQAKIKRWFESNKAMPRSIEPSSNGIAHRRSNEEFKVQLTELEDHLTQVQDINCQITNVISGLLNDKPSI